MWKNNIRKWKFWSTYYIVEALYIFYMNYLTLETVFKTIEFNTPFSFNGNSGELDKDHMLLSNIYDLNSVVSYYDSIWCPTLFLKVDLKVAQ